MSFENIRKRDNYTCFRCGFKAKDNHVHHIIPFKISEDNSPENLITLCPSHHKKEDNLYLRYGETRYVRDMLEEAKRRTENDNL